MAEGTGGTASDSRSGNQGQGQESELPGRLLTWPQSVRVRSAPPTKRDWMQITWGSWAWNRLMAAMLIPGHMATSNLWICLHACPMVSSVLQEDPCVSARSEAGPSPAQPRPCTALWATHCSVSRLQLDRLRCCSLGQELAAWAQPSSLRRLQ